MSDINDLIHTNARVAFDQGVKTERERILQIIARYRHKPSFGYENLISLIKGEQK